MPVSRDPLDEEHDAPQSASTAPAKHDTSDLASQTLIAVIVATT